MYKVNRFPSGSNPLLIQEQPIQFLPTLGGYIGVNEALFLQKLQEELSCSHLYVGGERWVRCTLDEWNLECFWMAKRTLQRVIQHLRSLKLDGQEFHLLKVECHEANPFSSIKWYSIDYDEFECLLPMAEKFAVARREELLLKRNLPLDSTHEERLRSVCPNLDDLVSQIS